MNSLPVKNSHLPSSPNIKLPLPSDCLAKGIYFPVDSSRSCASDPFAMPALRDPPACKNASGLRRQRRTVPVVPIIPRKLEKKPIRVVYRPSNSNSPAVNNELELSRQVSPTRPGCLDGTPAIEHNSSEEVVEGLASSFPEDIRLQNGSRGESMYFRL